jgi:hypothetical protein
VCKRTEFLLEAGIPTEKIGQNIENDPEHAETGGIPFQSLKYKAQTIE